MYSFPLLNGEVGVYLLGFKACLWFKCIAELFTYVSLSFSSLLANRPPLTPQPGKQECEVMDVAVADLAKY